MSEPTTTDLHAEEDLGLVSIVVPVYKVEAFLDECVSSILSQTYRDIEVILVDDGSPDGCGTICDGWAARDDRVRVVHQENAGLSAARNSGVDVARGNWVMFVDSDDYVGPDFCRRPLELALEHDADLVVFGFQRIDEDGSALPSCPTDILGVQGVLDPDEALVALASRKLNDYAWNKLYRRELVEQVRFFSKDRFEDQTTSYRFMERAHRVFVTKEPLCFYRQRNVSLSHAGGSEGWLICARHRDDASRYLSERHPEASRAMSVEAARNEYAFCRQRYAEGDVDETVRQTRSRLVNRHEDVRRLAPRTRAMVTLLAVSPAAFALVTRSIDARRTRTRRARS